MKCAVADKVNDPLIKIKKRMKVSCDALNIYLLYVMCLPTKFSIQPATVII